MCSGARSNPGGNSPSVVWPESFTGAFAEPVFTMGGTLAFSSDRIEGGNDPDALCSSAFQSGPFDAVRVPERLSGRIAPSVFARLTTSNSPASSVWPSIQLFLLRWSLTDPLVAHVRVHPDWPQSFPTRNVGRPLPFARRDLSPKISGFLGLCSRLVDAAASGQRWSLNPTWEDAKPRRS